MVGVWLGGNKQPTSCIHEGSSCSWDVEHLLFRHWSVWFLWSSTPQWSWLCSISFPVFPGMYLFGYQSCAASLGIKWVCHLTVSIWLWRKWLDSGVLTFMDHLMLLTSQLILNSKGDGMRLYYFRKKNVCIVYSLLPLKLLCLCVEDGGEGMYCKKPPHWVHIQYRIMEEKWREKRKNTIPNNRNKHSSTMLYLFHNNQ